MSTIEQINSYVEVKSKTSADLGQKGPIVSDRDSFLSTVDQTIINMVFAVPLIEGIKKLFYITIDGKQLHEGDDFSFTNIVNNSSAQITLNSPVAEGLRVDYSLIGTQIMPYPNPASTQAHLNNEVGNPLSWAEENFEDSVKKEYYTVPYSTFANIGTIENRAPIMDSSKTLAPLMGVERIMTPSINLLKDEFGPDGEQVFEADNKDKRIRFVGPNWVSLTSSQGSAAFMGVGNATDYLEVSFYGTGLNLLNLHDNAQRPIYITISNGSESADVYVIGSAILNSRGYGQNAIQPIASGLTLGWYTIKLRFSTSVESQYVHGIEILNDTMKVTQGLAWSGCQKQELTALSNTDYNAGIVGTNGARVVKYLKDGVISQVVQEVGSPLYLTSVNHDNEEIDKSINWKEFGRNRADDFSTLTTIRNAAFTLDDNVTALVGSGVSAGAGDGLDYTTSGYAILTFVGVGLDLECGGTGTTFDPFEIFVDGVSKGSITGNATIRTVSICSGLPYGTHTIKILRSTNLSSGMPTHEFIVYQPKKPTLPVNAIAISDYNVLADFVANTNSTTTNFVSQGVVRKHFTKEAIFIEGSGGTNDWYVTPAGNFAGGLLLQSNRADCSVSFTFFGTGFDFRFYSDSSRSASTTVRINGDLASLANFPTASYSVLGAGIAYVEGSGSFDMQGSGIIGGAGFIFKDLPLGTYTVDFHTNSAEWMSPQSLDVITPTHVNNISVGNLSLNDSRNFSAIPTLPTGEVDWSKAKALVVYSQVGNEILYSENIKQVLELSTSISSIYFKKPFKSEYYVAAGMVRNDNYFLGGVDLTEPQKHSKGHTTVVTKAHDGTSGNYIFSIAFFGELENE